MVNQSSIPKISILLALTLLSAQSQAVVEESITVVEPTSSQEYIMPLLKQDNTYTPITYAQDHDEVIDLGMIFFDGMDIQKFGSNWTTCYIRWVDFVYYEIPEIQLKFQYANVQEMIFNTTKLSQNVSNHMIVCTDAVVELIDFMDLTAEQFGSVGKWANALLQNLLGNIVSFYYIIENMIQAAEVEDQEELIYQSSRIIYFLFDFEPDSQGLYAPPTPVESHKQRLLSDKDDFLDSLINIYDEATDDGTNQGGGKQLLSLYGFTEFFSGFFSGSVGGSFEAIETCVVDVEVGWIKENYIFNENMQNGQTVSAIQNFWTMMWYLHKIMESCVVGAIFTYADMFWEMLQIYQYPKWIIINIIDNFDMMYESGYEGVQFFLFDNVAVQDNAAYDSGYDFGYILYLLLVLPEDNNNVSILDWAGEASSTA